MENRVTNLLGEIVSRPGISMNEISTKYHLTKTQIEYALKKINKLLLDHQHEIIERTNNHLFSLLTMDDYLLLVEKEGKDVNYSEHERKMIILSMLMLQEDLSLNHFIIELDVSKNTVLKTLKEIESMLKERKLTLSYSRKAGYLIKGKEIRIRQLLMEIIKSSDVNQPWLLDFYELTDDTLAQYAKMIESIENALHVRFSDETISQLPFILIAMKRRALNGHSLTADDMPDHDLLWQERTYVSTKEILEGYQITEGLNSFETAFLVIQILGSNLVFSNMKLHDHDIYVIAIKDMVRRFENMMAVSLPHKEKLYRQLYQHLMPANYRLKYGIPLVSPLADKIRKDYHFIHSIVRKAIFPLEEVMGCDYQDDELIYVTLIFASSFYYQRSNKSRKLQAVVLCENGVSISYLLTNVLKDLFPEISFIGHLSRRQFLKENLQVDLIFSTVYINHDVPLFLVTPFLSDEEKQSLRQRVYYQMQGIHVQNNFTVEDIMKIINQYADVANHEGLERELHQYLNDSKTPSSIPKQESTDYQPVLKELITKETIQIAAGALTFEEAIRVAAQPLIDLHYINSNYPDRIIQNYDKRESYFIISPQVAIPHSSNKGDVYKVGMSLLKLKESIYFENEQQWVDIIIVIAPYDQKSHIRAVTQLHNMMLNKDNIRNLVKAESESEIFDIFHEHL